MVIALVGRRIDQPGLDAPIFPYEAIERVRRRIKHFLQAQGARVIVCSAACGADLIALEAAGSLGIRRRVILPFDVSRFRETSVIDCPGDWGLIFDKIIAEVTSDQDLVILSLEQEADESYLRTNEAILGEALSLAASNREPVNAVLVWNGISRGNDDITNSFARTARSLGLQALELSSL